jgi:hypothetical protein
MRSEKELLEYAKNLAELRHILTDYIESNRPLFTAEGIEQAEWHLQRLAYAQDLLEWSAGSIDQEIDGSAEYTAKFVSELKAGTMHPRVFTKEWMR